MRRGNTRARPSVRRFSVARADGADNNFEIVSRRFFESEAYQTWFRFVDRNATGIYSRRWG